VIVALSRFGLRSFFVVRLFHETMRLNVVIGFWLPIAFDIPPL
jgi:hypothetical protein